MHTHTNLSNYSARINEIEAFTYGIADALIENGLLSSKAIYKVVENLKQRMIENQEQLHPEIQVRIDKETAKEYVAVNCPYFIRHEGGCCTHKDKVSGACTIYENRPRVCSEYSCATDDRIWKDFDKMELNLEYIQEHFNNPDFQGEG